MPADSTIHLALDARTNLHVLVRRVRIEALDRSYAPIEIEALNELLRARDIEALVRAAAELGPMTASQDWLEGWAYKPSDLQGRHPSIDLQDPDPDLLVHECYFDPFSQSTGDDPWEFDEVGRIARAATKRAAEDYAFSKEEDFSFADGRFVYVIEPLHNWLLMRNLVSIVLRIGAVFSADEGDDSTVLEDSGFRHVEPTSSAARSSMGGPGFVIPVAYNPSFSQPAISLTWKDDKIWPFYMSITEPGQTAVQRALGIARPRHLRGSADVRFLTSVQADQAEASLSIRARADESAKWIYLVLMQPEGKSQADVADAFLRALDGQFHKAEVRYTGISTSEIKTQAAPTTLAEAIWDVVRYHPSKYLMCCKYCHRTILAGLQGVKASFCSSACRASYNRELRVRDERH